MTKHLLLRAPLAPGDTATSWVFPHSLWLALSSILWGASFLHFCWRDNTTALSSFTLHSQWTTFLMPLAAMINFVVVVLDDEAWTFIFSSDFHKKSKFKILNVSIYLFLGCPIDISNSTFQKWMPYLLSKPDGHIISIFKSLRLKCENHF